MNKQDCRVIILIKTAIFIIEDQEKIFPNDHNKVAISKLKSAITQLEERNKNRVCVDGHAPYDVG